MRGWVVGYEGHGDQTRIQLRQRLRGVVYDTIAGKCTLVTHEAHGSCLRDVVSSPSITTIPRLARVTQQVGNSCG